MASDETPVVVTTGATASTYSVYHRDLPEIRAEGQNPKEAATHLSNALTRALDSALTDWRRNTLDKAIAEVQAFVEKGA
jgi:hypothetical protein